MHNILTTKQQVTHQVSSTEETSLNIDSDKTITEEEEEEDTDETSHRRKTRSMVASTANQEEEVVSPTTNQEEEMASPADSIPPEQWKSAEEACEKLQARQNWMSRIKEGIASVPKKILSRQTSKDQEEQDDSESIQFDFEENENESIFNPTNLDEQKYKEIIIPPNIVRESKFFGIKDEEGKRIKITQWDQCKSILQENQTASLQKSSNDEDSIDLWVNEATDDEEIEEESEDDSNSNYFSTGQKVSPFRFPIKQEGTPSSAIASTFSSFTWENVKKKNEETQKELMKENQKILQNIKEQNIQVLQNLEELKATKLKIEEDHEELNKHQIAIIEELKAE